MKLFWTFLFCAFSMITFSQNLEAELSNVYTQNQLMGMSVIGICNKEVKINFHKGFAHEKTKTLVNKNTKYRIASVSKTITTIALLQLYEKGLFKLDDDINKYLGFSLRNPHYPNVPITFRMLLSHTSSIVDGSGYESFTTKTYQTEMPPPISSLFTTQGDFYSPDMFLKKSPGSFFTYSNATYGIVGTLIEKISGMRFDIYCRKNIFLPLSLDASFNIQDIKNSQQIATLYRKTDAGWIPQIDDFQTTKPQKRNLTKYIVGSNGFIFAPQGGLRISAQDLTTLTLMFMNKGVFKNAKILKPETIKTMFTPQWTYNGSNGDDYHGLFKQWGLGVHITTQTLKSDLVFPNKKMTGHPGEAYGLISDWYMNLETGEAVIFITNGSAVPYKTGSKSAFYTPEEETFQLVYQFLEQKCKK
ncbi:MAG: beta-lactamase family protein [Raineya sp.]|jgi:CubicO group peptidase (beta-lactamase class C family)|nr:beta-lactamase family protein [Raineya sp.]